MLSTSINIRSGQQPSTPKPKVVDAPKSLTSKSNPPWSNMVRYKSHRQQQDIPTGKKGLKMTDEAAQQHRQSIALIYHQMFYKTDTPLNGKGGAIPSIAKMLSAHPSTVSNVVKECKAVFDQGDEYDASRKKFFRTNQRIIQPNTFLQQQIAIYKERLSFKSTAVIINAMRRLELGPAYDITKHYIGRKSISNALERMKHEVCKVEKVTQGSNKNLHWVQARLNWSAQLLVRFGRDLPPGFDKKILQPPTCADRSLIESCGLNLSLYQIAWWDEIHIKQRVGEVFDTIYRFAKNDQGFYDENGTINEEKLVSSLYLILL